jgi:hypothetical protein
VAITSNSNNHFCLSDDVAQLWLWLGCFSILVD